MGFYATDHLFIEKCPFGTTFGCFGIVEALNLHVCDKSNYFYDCRYFFEVR